MGAGGPERVTLAPLVEFLARRRGLLLGLYVAALLLAGFLTFFVSITAIPESFHVIAGSRDADLIDWEFDPWQARPTLIFLAGFLGLQAAFIWGAGRIRVSPGRPSRPLRFAVPVAVAAAILSLLCVGLYWTMMEASDRFRSVIRGDVIGILDDEEGLTSSIGPILAVMWALWIVVGLLLVRGAAPHAALSRLASILLAGSWIEFCTALAVDLSVRRREDDCPCAAGSYLTLLAAVPLLLWSVGPGILLLYLGQRRMEMESPGLARRILLRKSVRAS